MSHLSKLWQILTSPPGRAQLAGPALFYHAHRGTPQTEAGVFSRLDFAEKPQPLRGTESRLFRGCIILYMAEGWEPRSWLSQEMSCGDVLGQTNRHMDTVLKKDLSEVF